MFLRRLREFRRRELLRCGGAAALRQSLFAPPLALLAAAAVHFGVPLPAVAAAVVLLLAAVGGRRIGGAPWQLAECARRADLHQHGRLSVTNALELCRRDDGDDFDEYTLKLGVRALERNFPRPPLRLPWKSAVTLTIAALALLAFPAVTPASHNGGGTDDAEKATPPAAGTFRPERPATVKKAPPPRSAERSAAGAENTATAGAERTADTGSAPPATATSRSGATGSGGTPADLHADRPSEGEDAPDREAAPRRPGRPNSRSSSGGGDADDGDDAGDDPGAGAAGTRTLKAERSGSRRRPPRRPQPEPRPEGFQLPGFDRNPPAGREAAEHDEHGDHPGEGRGGDTGAKKARGTGTALPVIPLPDTVAGRPGAGNDALTPFRTAAGDSALPEERGIPARPAAPAAEPPTRHPGFTAKLRRQLRLSAIGHDRFSNRKP